MIIKELDNKCPKAELIIGDGIGFFCKVNKGKITLSCLTQKIWEKCVHNKDEMS